jgi:hypothetical protein
MKKRLLTNKRTVVKEYPNMLIENGSPPATERFEHSAKQLLPSHKALRSKSPKRAPDKPDFNKLTDIKPSVEMFKLEMPKQGYAKS